MVAPQISIPNIVFIFARIPETSGLNHLHFSPFSTSSAHVKFFALQTTGRRLVAEDTSSYSLSCHTMRNA